MISQLSCFWKFSYALHVLQLHALVTEEKKKRKKSVCRFNIGLQIAAHRQAEKQILLWHRLGRLNQNSISKVISSRPVTTACLRLRKLNERAVENVRGISLNAAILLNCQMTSTLIFR